MDTVPGGTEPELHLRDVGWMRALCRQLVRDRDLAEDVAQDTWLAALKASWPTGGHSRAWLAHVARNFARTRARGDLRRRAREVDAHAAGSDRAVRSPGELVARVEMQRLLSEAVLALDEPYRTTILLRFVEGLDPSEIARRAGIPAVTVSSRTTRALERLREELDRRSHGDRTQWLGGIAALARAARPAQHVVSAIGGVVIVKTLAWLATTVIVGVVGWWWFAHARSVPIDPALAAVKPGSSASAGAGQTDATTVTETSRAPAERAAPGTASSVPGHDRLALRLLDAATHESVPHLWVTLTGTIATETLETDDAGIVHCARIGADEPVVIDLSQSAHPSDLLQTKREIASAVPTSVRVEATNESKTPVRDVDVPVGPTYFLRGALPLGTGTFTARLTCADPSMAFDKMFAVVHADERTWMRFSPKARAISGGPPWQILVGSDDGLWSGSCQVTTIAGISATPLDVQFEPTARVRGTVTVAGGGTAGNTYVQMWKPGASFRDPKNRPVLAPTDDQGRFDVRWVAPGNYAIKVEAKGHPDFAKDVVVVAGTDQRFDVELQPASPTGNLVITLKSDTGTYTGAVRVHARSEGAHPAIIGTDVTWDTATGTGRTEFQDLERILHQVDASASDGTPVSPVSIAAEPDGRTIELVVRDRTPMSELAFDVRDAKTDAVVAFERILVRIPGADDPRPVLVDKKTLRARLPAAPRYAIEMRAHGYRPFRSEIASPTDGAPIVLRAAAGYGTEVHAVDGADHDLALVRILLDGHDCGTTDAKGVLDVELDAEPTTLKAVLEGWHMTDKGDPDPKTGRFRAWVQWVRVVMEKDAH